MNRIIFLIIFIHCFASTHIEVFSQTLSVSINGSAVIPCDSESGSLQASPSGGTPPYNYLWSNGSTWNTIYDLGPGVYTVTVTDNVGSTFTNSQTITTSSTFNLARTYYAPTLGNCDGGFACTAFHTSIQFSVPYGLVASPFGSQSGIYGGTICYNDPPVVVDYVTYPSQCPFNGPQFSLDPSILYSGPLAIVPSISHPCSSNTRFKITNQHKIDYSSIWPSVQNTSFINNIGILTDLSGNVISYDFPGFSLIQYADSLFIDFNLNLTGTFVVKYIEGPYEFDTLGVQLTDTFQLVAIECGTFMGNVFYDENSNCVNNGSPDLMLPNTFINIQPINVDVLTNKNGEFSAYLPYGNYTATHTNPFNMSQQCPTNSTIAFTLDSNNPSVITDFADTTSMNLQCDLSTSVITNQPRPGFNYKLQVKVRNTNLLLTSATTLTLQLDSTLTFISADNGGIYSNFEISWNVPPLNGFEEVYFSAILNIPSSNAIGTVLTSTASITQLPCDTLGGNNTVVHQRTVTGSFDPNEKSVSPVGVGPQHIIPPDYRLQYTIEFENVGNDTAFRAIVIDTLSPSLDVSSLQVEMSSHDYFVQINPPNILRFTFENILLPDSGTNNVESKGFISFSIEQFPDLANGTLVENRASIYFDYNAPVVTNSVFNTIKNSPTAICKNVVLQLDSTGIGTANPLDIDNGSFDFYGISSISISQNTFDCSNIGNNQCTFFATNLTGFSDSCYFTITVEDSTEVFANNLTVYLDSSGTATINASQIYNGSSNNCGISNYSLSQSVFTCSDIGVKTIQLFVGSLSGTYYSANSSINVFDTISPIVICRDTILHIDSNCIVTITPQDLISSSIVNCAPEFYSLSQSTFDCSDLGSNSILLSAIDMSGNISSCFSNVTIIDVTGIYDPQSTLQNASLIPNPSSGKLLLPEIAKGGSLIVTDFTGRTVYSENTIHQFEKDFSSLPEGIYIFKFVTRVGEVRLKWVKMDY